MLAFVQHGRIDREEAIAPNTGRQFKLDFEDVQHQLRTVFGMEITELFRKRRLLSVKNEILTLFPRCSDFPASDLYQNLAARGSQSAVSSSSKSYILNFILPASSSKSYILSFILPAAYRVPPILVPARNPSNTVEASYTGLYTFIVSIIFLLPRGAVAGSWLERYLKRANENSYILNRKKTDREFKRMERDGYIIKVCERDGSGEESIDYVVGPRGKAEVEERGVTGVVWKVYGMNDAEAAELERS